MTDLGHHSKTSQENVAVFYGQLETFKIIHPSKAYKIDKINLSFPPLINMAWNLRPFRIRRRSAILLLT